MRELLRYIHVVSAIALAGQLFMAAAALAASLKADSDPRVARFVQAMLKGTGRAIALPALLLLFVSGLGLTHAARIPWREAVWIWISLGLFFVFAGGIWHRMLIPLRQEMQRIVEGTGETGALPENYRKLARAWISASGICLALIAVILALMIWKPTL